MLFDLECFFVCVPTEMEAALSAAEKPHSLPPGSAPHLRTAVLPQPHGAVERYHKLRLLTHDGFSGEEDHGKEKGKLQKEIFIFVGHYLEIQIFPNNV